MSTQSIQSEFDWMAFTKTRHALDKSGNALPDQTPRPQPRNRPTKLHITCSNRPSLLSDICNLLASKQNGSVNIEASVMEAPMSNMQIFDATISLCSNHSENRLLGLIDAVEALEPDMIVT